MRRRVAAVALIVGLLVAVLPTTAWTEADPIPPHPPSPLAGLPDDIDHGQVVTLADGDRYEVTFAAQGQSIRGRRWDAATGTWGPRQVIFKDPDLRCWGVVARGAGTGVAVRFGCGPAFVEEWEGHPHAAVSADTVRWESRRLPGYGWWLPAVSPSGSRAAWSRGDDYLTWNAAEGFVRHDATPPKGVFGEAPMITDDGSVTIAYADESCSATFDTYSAAGAPARQVLPTSERCGYSGVLSIDAHSVAFGDFTNEWSNARLTRPDAVSPWVVATIAPLSAPGLLKDSFNRGMAPVVLDAADGPLAVVSNGEADELRVQFYDPATQSWQAPTTLVSRAGGTKCRYRNDLTSRLGFLALTLRCAGPDRFVTSRPDGSWIAVPLRAQAIGPNKALGLVAVPDRQQTVVVGQNTSTTLPVGTHGGCDVVIPIATDRLLRLTQGLGSSGWPTLLQRSTARGWQTVRRVRMPTTGECSRVYPGLGAGPAFQLVGRDRGVRVRFVEVDGRWDVLVR